MGRLCRRCLYERRDKPRRRDVLLRILHQLFAGISVGLNGFECNVLLAWLTEDPALAVVSEGLGHTTSSSVSCCGMFARGSGGWSKTPDSHPASRGPKLQLSILTSCSSSALSVA